MRTATVLGLIHLGAEVAVALLLHLATGALLFAHCDFGKPGLGFFLAVIPMETALSGAVPAALVALVLVRLMRSAASPARLMGCAVAASMLAEVALLMPELWRLRDVVLSFPADAAGMFLPVVVVAIPAAVLTALVAGRLRAEPGLQAGTAVQHVLCGTRPARRLAWTALALLALAALVGAEQLRDGAHARRPRDGRDGRPRGAGRGAPVPWIGWADVEERRQADRIDALLVLAAMSAGAGALMHVRRRRARRPDASPGAPLGEGARA